MPDLGAIATLEAHGVEPGWVWREVQLRALVITGETSYMAYATKDDTVGAEAPPSLKMTRYGFFEFAIPVETGTRRVTVKAKQVLPPTPRPKMVVKANPAIGIAADVETTAPSGSDWVTVGPTSFAVSAPGTVQVQLWCLAPGTAVECWFDDITTT